MGATSGLGRDGLVSAVFVQDRGWFTPIAPDRDLNPLVRGLLAAVPADVDNPDHDGPGGNTDISRDEVVDLTFWGSRRAARVP
jgi:hypothetical protein